jgi:ribosomal protein L1
LFSALKAGADLAGSDELIEDVLILTTIAFSSAYHFFSIHQVQKGIIAFDRCIATPDMMPKLGKIARVKSSHDYFSSAFFFRLMAGLTPQILGPRGLMPNPKLGSVTKDVAKAVKVSRFDCIRPSNFGTSS